MKNSIRYIDNKVYMASFLWPSDCMIYQHLCRLYYINKGPFVTLIQMINGRVDD